MALYNVDQHSISLLGHSRVTEHTDTVCLSLFTCAWAHSCTVCLCTLHTRCFIKHRCYFSLCFLAIVSTSSDSLYTDSLLRLLLVCNVITNAAEFNQEKEGLTGTKWLLWGSSHEMREFLHVWSPLINPVCIRGPQHITYLNRFRHTVCNEMQYPWVPRDQM